MTISISIRRSSQSPAAVWPVHQGSLIRRYISMTRMISSVLFVLTVVGGSIFAQPVLTWAAGNDCCCQQCRQPCGRCCCRTAHARASSNQCGCGRQNCGCAQKTTCRDRDVVSTEYRDEEFLETYPTTVNELVTVDEGNYQTVWVPKMVTKSVAKTVYQSRTAHRSVPYQVTRRVNDCTTESVEVQSSRSGSNLGSFGYMGRSPTPSTGSAVASSRSYPTPVTSSSTGLVPDARYAEPSVASRATSINPRSGSRASGVDNSRVADRSSMFVPAPSAAQVWRSTTVR